MADHSTKLTFEYKKAGDVSIKADVYLPDETKFGVVANVAQQIMNQMLGKSTGEKDHKLPVLIYFHGGGLTVGSKTGWFPEWLRKDALNAGFALISPDYTLLGPQTAASIVEDVKDLFTWISTSLNTELSRSTSQLVNSDKIAVSGHSAGGYLSYIAGLYASPHPKASFTIYPMGGDYLLDSWLAGKTEPFMIGGPLAADDSAVKSLLDQPAASHVVSSSVEDPLNPRMGYFPALLQYGVFLDAFTGIKGLSDTLRPLPYADRAAAVPQEVAYLFPQLATIDSSFPATYSVHGGADLAVSTDESRAMHRKLQAAGVKSVLTVVEGKDHGFDMVSTDSADFESHAKAVPWLLEQLN